jgi:ATP-dependent helicase/nuclease subunit A
MNSEVWRRARAARRCLTEVPFVVTMPESLVRGVIDLAFEEADGWVLVDYKTDRTADRRLGELAETYRPQLDAYRAAWAQIASEPVQEAGLYFTHVSRYVKITP